MELKALWTIQRASDAKPPVVAPGRTFTTTKEEGDRLIAMGAAALVDADNAAPESQTSRTLDRTDLEARADAVGVKYRVNTTDETLLKNVEAAETAAADKQQKQAEADAAAAAKAKADADAKAKADGDAKAKADADAKAKGGDDLLA